MFPVLTQYRASENPPSKHAAWPSTRRVPKALRRPRCATFGTTIADNDKCALTTPQHQASILSSIRLELSDQASIWTQSDTMENQSGQYVSGELDSTHELLEVCHDACRNAI